MKRQNKVHSEHVIEPQFFLRKVNFPIFYFHDWTPTSTVKTQRFKTELNSTTEERFSIYFHLAHISIYSTDFWFREVVVKKK